jgi:hypothetical protein
MFGARIGPSRLAERAYAAADVLAAGGWLAVAARSARSRRRCRKHWASAR